MSTENKDRMAMPSGQHKMGPNTAVLAAYNPDDHGGAVAVPNVNAATYAFLEADQGEHAFGCGYSLSETVARLEADGKYSQAADIYARLSGPTIRVVEDQLKALEPKSDWACVFPSGMAALNTLVHTTLHHALGDSEDEPVRDVILHSPVLYGGTHALMHNVLLRWNFISVEADLSDPTKMKALIKQYGNRIGMVLCETPANPTLDMTDIQAVADILAEHYPNGHKPVFVVDNTFMGIFQNPLLHGADVAYYSCTKYMGGHSDLLAGALIGKDGRLARVKLFDGSLVDAPLFAGIMMLRTIGGWTTSSDVAQRLSVHLHTYRLRMKRQAAVATEVAQFLSTHEKVAHVGFPTMLSGKAKAIYAKQCDGPSGMIAFRLHEDTKEAAFKFLNALELIIRAVSLGSTRTLANHPSTWTHSDVNPADQARLGISGGLIRFSVGIEDHEDLINDLRQALEAV